MPVRVLLRVLPCLLLALSAAACSTAAATSVPPVAVEDPGSHPAVLLVRRIEATVGAPDLQGMPLREASARLGESGVEMMVIAFDHGDSVTAQYPEPGAPLSAGEPMLVWVGEPPAPPPPPEPEEPAEVEEAPAGEEDGEEDGQPAALWAGAAPSSAAPSVTTSGGPPAGWQPPPRSNIREMPPAEPGTVMSGPASWYGPGFEGRTTACLGAYDSSQLTLATRELRCGTLVRVTGPSGASVEAKVTDWGPAEWTGRRFDLSHATFAAIHHPGAGVVDVTVEVLGP